MKVVSRETSNQTTDADVWILQSDISGAIFRVSVAGPGVPLPAGVKIDAVYGTDGDLAGGANITAARAIPMGGIHAPLYVINVGYPAEAGPMAWAANRVRDFTPASRPDLDPLFAKMAPGMPKTGGGRAFLGFLADELKPLVESEYPVRAGPAGLLGDSAGGFFVLYALAAAPQHFDRVLCVSPALSLYRDAAFARAFDAFVAEAVPSAARRFVCAGEHDRREHWRAFVESSSEPYRSSAVELCERTGWPDLLQDSLDAAALFAKRKGLEIKSHIMPNEHHGSVYGVALSHGLRWLYRAADARA